MTEQRAKDIAYSVLGLLLLAAILFWSSSFVAGAILLLVWILTSNRKAKP